MNNEKKADFIYDNLSIQNNVIHGSFRVGVKNLVFLGSSCIYPRNCAQPIKEDYLLTGELEQTNSAYAIAKIAGIEMIKSYRKEYGYSWISVMPTNLYGPNDSFDLENSHVLPALIRKFVEAKRNNLSEVVLWGSGTPLREFLHVDDLAKAVLVCLEKYDDSQQINIGSGDEISIKDLGQKIANLTRFTGKVVWDANRPDGTPRKVLDSTKINKLGWKPAITLDQGIAATVEWYQENK